MGSGCGDSRCRDYHPAVTDRTGALGATQADLSVVHVVVPLRAIESGKSRLGQALDAEEREVLVLAYDHGLSQSEIAERLGLPIGTVKSRTRRALAALRDRLEDVPDLRPGAPGVAATPSAEDGR